MQSHCHCICMPVTDTDQRSQNLRHLYPGMGFQLGVFGAFPTIKITVICQVCIYYGLSVKINMCEMPHGTWRSWTHFGCVWFCMWGWQKPKYSQLELHGWWCHYTGRKRSSGISLLYLWCQFISFLCTLPVCQVRITSKLHTSAQEKCAPTSLPTWNHTDWSMQTS